MTKTVNLEGIVKGKLFPLTDLICEKMKNGIPFIGGCMVALVFSSIFGLEILAQITFILFIALAFIYIAGVISIAALSVLIIFWCVIELTKYFLIKH